MKQTILNFVKKASLGSIADDKTAEVIAIVLLTLLILFFVFILPGFMVSDDPSDHMHSDEQHLQ